MPLAGDEVAACRRLFKSMIRARGGAKPDCLVKEGLITRGVFSTIAEKIERGFEKNWEETRSRPSRIVKLAKRLKLLPMPDSRQVGFWHAQCPSRRGHGIILDADKDMFYCGYCCKKGGPDELRQFMVSRKKAS